jgi:soluble lytic murein transglycosylase-like protein
MMAGVLTCLLAAVEGRADMFVCDDGRGRMHFTNTPTGQNCKPFTPRQKYIESPRNTFRVYRGTYRGIISPSSYDQYIKRVGSMYNVDPYLIKAVIRTESAFNHRAVSSKGALGLMQLMPGTAADLRVENPLNAGENIDGGVRYLRSLLDTFDNNLILSLAAYNAGPGLVKRTGGVPRIPETIDYVRKVLSNYRMYKTSGG